MRNRVPFRLQPTATRCAARPGGGRKAHGQCDHWDHSPLAAPRRTSRWGLRPLPRNRAGAPSSSAFGSAAYPLGAIDPSELVPVFVAGKPMGFLRKPNDALLMVCLRHYRRARGTPPRNAR